MLMCQYWVVITLRNTLLLLNGKLKQQIRSRFNADITLIYFIPVHMFLFVKVFLFKIDRHT